MRGVRDDDDGGDGGTKTGKVDPFSVKDRTIDDIINEVVHPHSVKTPYTRIRDPRITRSRDPRITRTAVTPETIFNRIKALEQRFSHVNPISNAVLDVRTTNPVTVTEQEKKYDKIKSLISNLVRNFQNNPQTITNANICLVV